MCKYTLSELIHSSAVGLWVGFAIAVKAVINILIYTALTLIFEGFKVPTLMEAHIPCLKT